MRKESVMSRLVKSACGVVLAIGLTGCVAADGSVGYSVGVGYGSPGFHFGYGFDSYGYGYEPYGYGYGTYYGSLMFGGAWYDGPYRYRRGRFGREYWWRDRWRRADRDGDGQWQDDPPEQGDNAGNEPPPRPNAGFWRERQAAAARARAEENNRRNDRPAINTGGNDAPANAGGGGGNAGANNARVAPPRPGPGQAAARARARAGVDREVE
jgi:hypothetical protein